MKLTYAIGDIHGRDHLLEKMYARIETDPYRPTNIKNPIVVHLGDYICLLYTSPSPRDATLSGMPSSA